MKFFRKSAKPQQTLDLEIAWGGYYTYCSEGTWQVFRLLDFNRNAIHRALYREQFDHEPTAADIQPLIPSAGHAPHPSRVVFGWDGLKFLYAEPLTIHDLADYNELRKNQGMDQTEREELILRIIRCSRHQDPLHVRLTQGKNKISLELGQATAS